MGIIGAELNWIFFTPCTGTLRQYVMHIVRVFASHVCRECNALSVLEDARYGRDGTKHAISHGSK